MLEIFPITLLLYSNKMYIDWQGFGMLLMEEAERIAMEEHGSSKIAVISGN